MEKSLGNQPSGGSFRQLLNIYGLKISPWFLWCWLINIIAKNVSISFYSTMLYTKRDISIQSNNLNLTPFPNLFQWDIFHNRQYLYTWGTQQVSRHSSKSIPVENLWNGACKIESWNLVKIGNVYNLLNNYGYMLTLTELDPDAIEIKVALIRSDSAALQ